MMKKQFIFSVLAVVLIMGCANASTPGFSVIEESETRSTDINTDNTDNNANTQSVSSIEGIEWKLIEVYIDGKDTRFSRNTLPDEPGNLFTLNLDAQYISGVGVPNRYSAPYTRDSQTIKINLIRATLMASFFQPENLNEYDFFVFLQNAYSWKLADNNLELLSKTENGAEVKLVFSL